MVIMAAGAFAGGGGGTRFAESLCEGGGEQEGCATYGSQTSGHLFGSERAMGGSKQGEKSGKGGMCGLGCRDQRVDMVLFGRIARRGK